MTQIHLKKLIRNKRKKDVLSLLKQTGAYIASLASILLMWYLIWVPSNIAEHFAGEIQVSSALDTDVCSENPMGMISSDCEALIDFYNTTDWDSWTTNTDWGTTWVNWYGITVSGGRVVEINLNNNHLMWYMSTGIWNLEFLTQLNINNNWLNWTIPVEIFNLNYLETLDIASNNLSWSISHDRSNLTWVSSVLHLDGNNFAGAVPLSLLNYFEDDDNLYINNAGLCGIFPELLSWIIDDYNVLTINTSGQINWQLCSAWLYCNNGDDCSSGLCTDNVCIWDGEPTENKPLNIIKSISGGIYDYISGDTVYYYINRYNTGTELITWWVIIDEFGTGLVFSGTNFWWSYTTWPSEVILSGIVFTWDTTSQIVLWFTAVWSPWDIITNTWYMWVMSWWWLYTWYNQNRYSTTNIGINASCTIDSECSDGYMCNEGGMCIPTPKTLNITKIVSGDFNYYSGEIVYYHLDWSNTGDISYTGQIIDQFDTGLTYLSSTIVPTDTNLLMKQIIYSGLNFEAHSTGRITLWFEVYGETWAVIYNTWYMYVFSGEDTEYTWYNNYWYNPKHINITWDTVDQPEDEELDLLGIEKIINGRRKMIDWVWSYPGNLITWSDLYNSGDVIEYNLHWTKYSTGELPIMIKDQYNTGTLDFFQAQLLYNTWATPQSWYWDPVDAITNTWELTFVFTWNSGSDISWDIIVRFIVKWSSWNLLSNTGMIWLSGDLWLVEDTTTWDNTSYTGTYITADRQKVSLYINKTSDKDDYISGELITWTINFGNTGEVACQNLKLIDNYYYYATWSAPQYNSWHLDFGTNGTIWGYSYTFSQVSGLVIDIWSLGTWQTGSITLTGIARWFRIENYVNIHLSWDCENPDYDYDSNISSSKSINIISPITPALYISKSVNTGVTASGTVVTYTLTYSSNVLCSGTVIEDILPPTSRFTFGWATQNGISISGNIVSNIWRYNIGWLQPNTTGTIIITWVVHGNTNDTIINTGTIHGNCIGTTSTATASLLIQNPNTDTSSTADLRITKQVIQSWNPTVYRITYINNGPSTATWVVITEYLPANTFATLSYSIMPTNNQWSLWNLPSWASGTIIITWNLLSNFSGTYTNTVTIGSTTYDNNLNNNTSSATTTYNPTNTYVDLGVTKSVPSNYISKWSSFIRRITYRNHGNKTAYDVCITESIPYWLTYLSNNLGISPSYLWSNSLRFCIGHLNAWQQGILDITTRWDTVGIHNNHVYITWSENTNTNNDNAYASVTIYDPTDTNTNNTWSDTNNNTYQDNQTISYLQNQVNTLKNQINDTYTYINNVLSSYWQANIQKWVWVTILPKTGASR